MILDFYLEIGLINIAILLLSSFFLGYAIDLIMHRHGFGIWTHMLIIDIQFPLGFSLSKLHLPSALSLHEHMIIALAAAFLTILFLAMLKFATLRY